MAFRVAGGRIRGFRSLRPIWPDLSGAFEDIRREALVERLVARRRAPGEGTAAAGCAGAPSNFELRQPVRSSISVRWPEPPDPEDESEPCGNPDVYTAETWEDHDIRVENPDDSEQYVMVKRLDTVCFLRGDGTQVQLDLTKIWQTIEAE
jgi:hypothetical protein